MEDDHEPKSFNFLVECQNVDTDTVQECLYKLMREAVISVIQKSSEELEPEFSKGGKATNKSVQVTILFSEYDWNQLRLF